MGMPFALGVRLLGRDSPPVVPWMWGINGAASVLGTVAAGCFSMNFGFRITYLLGIFFYAGALAATLRVRRATAPDRNLAPAG